MMPDAMFQTDEQQAPLLPLQDSGFFGGSDEKVAVYDKPLFADRRSGLKVGERVHVWLPPRLVHVRARGQASIYKFHKDPVLSSSSMGPKRFAGADAKDLTSSSARRFAPVEFECEDEEAPVFLTGGGSDYLCVPCCCLPVLALCRDRVEGSGCALSILRQKAYVNGTLNRLNPINPPRTLPYIFAAGSLGPAHSHHPIKVVARRPR